MKRKDYRTPIWGASVYNIFVRAIANALSQRHKEKDGKDGNREAYVPNMRLLQRLIRQQFCSNATHSSTQSAC